MTAPNQGEILEGSFWPEPVRVLNVERLGERIKLEAVGTRTHQFYSRILSEADLAGVRCTRGGRRDFQGRAESFF